MPESGAKRFLIETGDQPITGESLAAPAESGLPQFNDGIVKKAWQNVQDAEKTGSREIERAPSDRDVEIDDQAFSPEVESLLKNGIGLVRALLDAICKNRHRLRELVKQLQKQRKAPSPCVAPNITYDDLFDYLTRELWFPYFARNVNVYNQERSSLETCDYNATAGKWVDQLLDMMLFDLITLVSGEKKFGCYVYHGADASTILDRASARNVLEGRNQDSAVYKKKPFTTLWEFLNEAVFPRCLMFSVRGSSKEMELDSVKRDKRTDQERKESENKLQDFLHNAPVYIFRQYYFEKAGQVLPRNKTVDLRSEKQIDEFIFWVCNNFSAFHNVGQKEKTAMDMPTDSDFKQLMPDFSKLGGVSAELKVLTLKNYFKARVTAALAEQSNRRADGLAAFELRFWGALNGSEISRNAAVHEDIENFLRKRWYHIFQSRKKIADNRQKIIMKYEQMAAEPDVEELVTFAKYLFGLYSVAKVYEKSCDNEQQTEGKVYMEIVRLYGQQLEQTVVNLEARLNAPNFKPDDLSAAIFTVQSLMNRTVIAGQRRQIGEVESDIKLIGEATAEAENAMDEGADFDERLAKAR